MLLNPEKNSVESPCVRNCCLDEKDICMGCHRSFDEILQWSKVSDDIKKTILVKTELRKLERHC
jgi:predicted Fe-S protein YdhL (DUF1289 family)